MGQAGKRAGGFSGRPPGGIRQRPEHLTTRVFTAGITFAAALRRLSQHEVRGILQNPLVLQRSIDDPQ